MSDKLNFSPESLSRLQTYSLLVLEGPDAVAFIQAQSMNDVKALTDGQWHWNGLLNPKGRLIALFALLRIRADLLYLLSPDFAAEKLGSHLQRFIFRSKVKLVLDRDKVFAAEFDVEIGSNLPRDFIIGNAEDGLALDFSSEAVGRRLWLLPMKLGAAISYRPSIEASWRDADIHHGLPRFSETQTELWTPQMLSLERLNAYSLKKGCYPGQEIVARTHYLGQAKRQMVLLEGQQLTPEMAVFSAQEKVGEIICTSSQHDHGLAVMQSTVDSSQLICGENGVTPLQALTGLQRPV